MTSLPDALESGADQAIAVLVESPQHGGLSGPLDYLAAQDLPAGSLVRVPLGAREVAGICLLYTSPSPRD